MGRFVRSTFTNATVQVDGNQYEECRFQNCLLEYGGTADVSFVGCVFIDSTWSFVDAAGRTLNFLSALYHGMGQDGQQLVEDVFTTIRSGVSISTDAEQ